MTEITDLPAEVVLFLLKKLRWYDLCRMTQSCTFFRKICELDDTWKYFCRRDYGICSIDKWSVDTFKELYKTVLIKYGYLIGEWKINLYPYGGILSVEVEPGRIIGCLWNPPTHPKITEPVRKQVIFELRIKDKQCICNCLSGKSLPHLGKLHKAHHGNHFEDPPSRFCFECQEHSKHPCSINSPDHKQWYSAEFPDFPPQMFIRRYKAYSELYKNTECEKLQWPNPICRESLPKPGLFKGTYSSHGIEFIMVHISSSQIIGTKVTGDPNVPATKVTFKVELNQAVSLDEIRELDSLDLDEDSLDQDDVSLTDFRLPDGFSSDYKSYPTKVKARYHGVGQIAFDGYLNPQWTPSHFIVFNENLFAVLWIELRSLSLYSRVNR